MSDLAFFASLLKMIVLGPPVCEWLELALFKPAKMVVLDSLVGE